MNESSQKVKHDISKKGSQSWGLLAIVLGSLVTLVLVIVKAYIDHH